LQKPSQRKKDLFFNKSLIKIPPNPHQVALWYQRPISFENTSKNKFKNH
jgi:hypothetical protein